jgi:hypothetical protein
LKGLFRVIRFVYIYKKATSFVKRKQLRVRFDNGNVYDIASPVERVIKILCDLRDSIDSKEKAFVVSLNYCIEVISSNRLYDVNSLFSDEAGPNWWDHFSLQSYEYEEDEQEKPEGSGESKNSSSIFEGDSSV